MAKKIVGFIKLQVPAGKANPSPPIGPALGQRGLNIMEFCKAFNANTEKFGALDPFGGLLTLVLNPPAAVEMSNPDATNLHFVPANGGTEQTGLAFSADLIKWMRYPANPVVPVRAGGFDSNFASDPKVFRDGDHWTMFYFGVGHGGAHIMAAFSRDLVHWTAHPEPLYKAGGNPSGLDKQYAHKISLAYNPKNETFYMYYCACGSRGRGIGLITSKPL